MELRVSRPPPKPVLIFDGDCGFCRRLVARWRTATGDTVEFVAFQDSSVAVRFPELPREECERAVQWVATDGTVCVGAEAVFHVMAASNAAPLWLYRHVPGVAPVSEWAYRVVAEHRSFFSTLTRWLWGTSETKSAYTWIRWLFLRWLGVIYLIAFVSLWAQVTGLIGHDGILPADRRMAALRQVADQRQVGWARYRLEPTFCWWRADNASLEAQCAAGAFLAGLVIVGVAQGPALLLAWALYLSLTTVGGVFLGYQWDNLLLEAGFLAAWFAPWRVWSNTRRELPPSRLLIWLFRWLLFRLMFSSGVVKLLSGDPTWRHLTALTYHYHTQPLPTWVAWYAQQLPLWFQEASCALVLVVELGVPWLIFMPRRLRLLAFWPLVGLQLLIALTGNYTFFNWLTIGLCGLLLDDQALRRCVPRRWRGPLAPAFPNVCALATWKWRTRWLVQGAVAVVILPVSLMLMGGTIGQRIPWPAPMVWLYNETAPFRTVNSYGLFAVMTTTRPEIIIQGSQDGHTWRDYGFKYKPGNVKRAPTFVAPYQPRLDWQMWFAALGSVNENPWFLQFVHRLLDGSPAVLRLMGHNPFPHSPPHWIRAVIYDYRFTTFAERRQKGAWWRRRFRGLYCPVLSLRDFHAAEPGSGEATAQPRGLFRLASFQRISTPFLNPPSGS